YRAATPATTGPSTATTLAATRPAPMTAYGVPFDNYDYLQKLAADIQKQYNVLPTVASIADTFKSDKELQALPGIGQARSFAAYATMFVEPFLPEAQRHTPNVLAILQPSQVLPDDRGNNYIFRVTAADPSHKPASMS